MHPLLYNGIAASARPAAGPAPSAPEVLDVTETSFGADATSHLVNMAATVNAGDLLFMACSFGGPQTVSTPAGWTLGWSISTDTFGRFAVFTKVADGTEGGTQVDVVTSGAVTGAAQVYRIANWSEFDADAASIVSASSISPDPALGTASWGSDNNLWIAVFGAGDDDETVSAYPANYTDGIDTVSGGGLNNGATVGSARRILASATEDPGAFTITDSETWHAGLFIVRPGSQSFAMTGNFDGGNLDMSASSIDNAGTATPTVNIVPRSTFHPFLEGGSDAWRHLYLRLSGADGKTPTFALDTTDLIVDLSSFPDWRPWYSLDNVTWTRWPSAPAQVGTSAVWTFSLGQAFTQNTVWIAFLPAYPVSRSQDLIDWLLQNHPTLIHETTSGGPDYIAATLTAQTDDDGRAIPPQPLYSYEIRDDSLTPDHVGTKQFCLVAGGIHAGEQSGDFVLEGFIKWLVGSTQEAIDCRKHFRFLVYPCMNPMGRWGGHIRTQWDVVEGELIDMNRDFVNEALESTQALTAAIVTDAGAADIVWAIDTHTTRQDGSPLAFLLHDSRQDAATLASFNSALDAAGGADFIFSSASAATWLIGWLHDNFNTEHSYVIEQTEYSLIPDTAALEELGEFLGVALRENLYAAPTQFNFTVASGAFPVVEGTAEGSTDTNDATPTINLPAGIQSGDVLIVFLCGDGQGGHNLPAGWTQITGITATSFSGSVWVRVADGTEGSSVEATLAFGMKTGHVSYRISGASGNVEAEDGSVTTTSTPDPPSLSPSWGAKTTLWLAAALHNAVNSVESAVPSGYSNPQYVTEPFLSSGSVYSAQRNNEVVTEDPGTFTLSESRQSWPVTVAIEPA